ncbi:hypothetical protein FOZ63_027398 [Perkinsus olseni]|uniref:Uncharacterized protein n=1 Tax=Perkinsus olseni TaxID=32597 RepID=A0A7J6SD84_PEROL|nr:hypothetical protein FOZ62_010298 [Perkinsus olseni]KAF4756927.1 hypothetical protein FOZ63_027398 [Perkinsus olseni]
MDSIDRNIRRRCSWKLSPSEKTALHWRVSSDNTVTPSHPEPKGSRVGKVDLLDSDLRLYTGNFSYELFEVNITLRSSDLKTLQEKYPKKINSTTFGTLKFDEGFNFVDVTYADGILTRYKRIAPETQH